MSKSFTSTWLRGLTKLAQIQTKLVRNALKQSAAKTSAGAKASKAGKAKVQAARIDPLGLRSPGLPPAKSSRKTAGRPKAASASAARSISQAASQVASPAALQAAAQPANAAATAVRKPAASRQTIESRVRPARDAWLKGDWTRSFHSAPPAPGDLVSHLAYGLYMPAAKGKDKRPLVVMLHGCKQTSEEFAQGTRMNALADEYGFAVLYPEQSRLSHAHRCWHWYDRSERAGDHEARAIVSLVEAVIEREDIDPTRVYVAGMSAGGGMATLLAVRYAHLFAAVAVHSGPVFGDAHSAISALSTMRRGTRENPLALISGIPEFAAHPGMPAIIVHGESDDVVSPHNGGQLAQQFVRLNRFVDASGQRLHGTERDSAAPGLARRDWILDDVPVVRLCRIEQLRHAWSGGDGAIPFHVSEGPESSRLIYDFFRLHRRTATATHPLAQPVLVI
jgi:poly(hydroxyalkanoate) depolymerase family esterase